MAPGKAKKALALLKQQVEDEVEFASGNNAQLSKKVVTLNSNLKSES